MLIELNGHATPPTISLIAMLTVTGSESTAIKFATVTYERLQAKYDTTKSLNTEVVLQQVTQTAPRLLTLALHYLDRVISCVKTPSGVHWTLATVQLQCMLAALYMSSLK